MASTHPSDLDTWSKDQLMTAILPVYERVWQEQKKLSTLPVSTMFWLKPDDHPVKICRTLRDAVSYLLFDSMRISAQPDFSERMGFHKKPLRPVSEGVVADWMQLPGVTRGLRRGWSDLGSSIYALDDDAVKAEWVYEKKSNQKAHLTVEVVLFSAGQAGAIEYMEGVGHTSNMMTNPFGPAPDSMKLGDFAAICYHGLRATPGSPINDFFWVYRNAFVRVRVDKRKGTEVFPMARAIMAFMEQYAVQDLPSHLPKVGQIQVSPPEVTVGQLLRVSVPVAPLSPSLQIEIQTTDEELKFQAEDATSTTFLLQAAAHAVIKAVIWNKQTLLSTRRQLSINIAAASR